MPNRSRANKAEPVGTAPRLRLAASEGLLMTDSREQDLDLTDSEAALELVSFVKYVQGRLSAESTLRVDLATLAARLERYQSRL
jgi:hypothetical protein